LSDTIKLSSILSFSHLKVKFLDGVNHR